MIQYYDDHELACVDGYSFRIDKKTGYYLSSKKIDGKRKRLHVYVWEKENGKVPKNFHVHHIDGNKDNNDISNLTLMARSVHEKYHGSKMDNEQRERAKQVLIDIAIPLSKEWHRSEEGKEWHRKHGVEAYKKRKPIRYCCTYCGTSFETTKIYKAGSNTFCSNKCKAAYRRESGVDNIVKKCEKCGGEFIANKYSSVKYCKDCQNKLGYPRGRIQHGGKGQS